MTQEQKAALEKDIVYAAHIAEQEAAALRLRLAMAGQHLQTLGRAMEEHPEHVNILPDPHSIYDYSEGMKVLRDAGNIVLMLEELPRVEARAKTAERRKGLLSLQSFSREAPGHSA